MTDDGDDDGSMVLAPADAGPDEHHADDASGRRPTRATALLHYGEHLRVRLDATTLRNATEAIGAHATRGGWVTVTGDDGRRWSFLVTPGVPLWVEH